MKKQILVLSILAGLSACGTNEMPNYYTGPTQDAVIDATNVADFESIVSDSSGTQYAFSGFSGFAMKPLSKAMNVIEKVKSRETVSIPGDCGGSISVNTSSQTSYSMNFNDYCLTSFGGTEETMSGSLTVTGSGTTANFTIDMSVTSDGAVYTMFGTMSMSEDASGQEIITMNFSANDSETGDSGSLENYKMVWNDGEFVSTSGKVCSTDIDGCVNIKTTVDFVYDDVEGGFTAGTLTISAGAAVITISVDADTGYCDLGADIDGDGTNDSETLNTPCYRYI